MVWLHRVKIRHLFTEKEDLQSVRRSMAAVANVLKATPAFAGFDVRRFYKIPKGDNVVAPVDYANRLLDRMYDYADVNRIWVE